MEDLTGILPDAEERTSAELDYFPHTKKVVLAHNNSNFFAYIPPNQK